MDEVIEMPHELSKYHNTMARLQQIPWSKSIDLSLWHFQIDGFRASSKRFAPTRAVCHVEHLEVFIVLPYHRLAINTWGNFSFQTYAKNKYTVVSRHVNVNITVNLISLKKFDREAIAKSKNQTEHTSSNHLSSKPFMFVNIKFP